MLDHASVKEFQELYQKEFGIALSIEEASELAERLLRFYKTIFKPTEKEKSHEQNPKDNL